MEAPWKAIHLAGGYGQIHYRMFYGSPSHSPRGAPVEVERLPVGWKVSALPPPTAALRGGGEVVGG